MPAGMERTTRAALKVSRDRLAQQKRLPNPSAALIARYEYEIRHHRAVLASLGGDETAARRIAGYAAPQPAAHVSEVEEEQKQRASSSSGYTATPERAPYQEPAPIQYEISPRGTVEPVPAPAPYTPPTLDYGGALPSEMSPWVLGLGALVVLALLGGRR